MFFKRGEPLLIDMDWLATGHPIVELSDLNDFYMENISAFVAQAEQFDGITMLCFRYNGPGGEEHERTDI